MPSLGIFSGQANTEGFFNAFFGALAGELNTTGTDNTFVGGYAGNSNTTASGNSFFGQNTGSQTNTGGNNAFFGRIAGGLNSTGSFNTAVGFNADFSSGNLTYATAIGADAVASTSNSVWLGRDLDIVYVPGFIRVAQLGGAGAQSICRNANDTISTCSSSLRYKTNIGQYSPGMSFVNQLRPMSFDWKDGGMKDVGFGAEDIAKIDPRFVTYNDKGEVEGVKYDRLSVVFANALKEQQQQIEKQQALIEQLEKRLEQLEKKEQK